jgi:hypothetical protein
MRWAYHGSRTDGHSRRAGKARHVVTRGGPPSGFSHARPASGRVIFPPLILPYSAMPNCVRAYASLVRSSPAVMNTIGTFSACLTPAACAPVEVEEKVGECDGDRLSEFV